MRAAAGALDELDANLRECRIREHGAQHSNRAPGERARALSLNTRQTLVIMPLVPTSSPSAISTWVSELICAAAATTFKKGSFHHFSPMR